MTSVAVERVLAALEQAGCEPHKSGDGYESRCPSHDDDKPSLSIGQGDDGRALLNCHAGCYWGDVLSAMNLKVEDLFISSNGTASSAPPRAQVKPKYREALEIVSTHLYCDEQGTVLFESVRLRPKTFRLRHLNGDGKYIWNAKGIRRVLYGLPAIIAAPADAVIFVVEGEKDADRLRAEGLFATTSSMGAKHWNLTDSTALHGRRVCVLADADEDGSRYAVDVATSLHGRGGSVTVLELPDLAEHGDVSDWLDAGNDPADLDQLVLESPEWTPPAGGRPPVEAAPDLKLVRPPSAVATMSRDAAIRERRGIFVSFNEENCAKMATCIKLAKFYAPGGGAEVLGDDRGSLPLAYFASPMGCTVGRISQRVAAGRLWLDHIENDALSPGNSGGVYHGKHADPLAERLVERHLRPLLKLRPAQQGEALTRGFAIARERHAVEMAEREAMGRKPKQLAVLSRDFAQAASEILPNPGAGDENSGRKLLLQATALVNSAAAIPGCPRKIIESARAVRQEIQAWNK